MDFKTLENSKHKEINWEDYQQELARLISLYSTLEKSEQNKLLLRKKLESLVKREAESLSRKNELDAISQRVEEKKLVLGNISMQAKVIEEHVKTKEEHLSGEIRSLLVSGNSLTTAQKKLQYKLYNLEHCDSERRKESSRLLAGEKGYARLNSLQKMLRARQQHMISHVAFIYPVKTMIGATQERELDSFPTSNTSGASGRLIDGNRKKSQGIMIISGVHLSMTPFKHMSLFTDKKQMQKSTAALGYVAHALSLIASYLKVPLRYPLHLGGSHSCIKDCAPLVEPPSSGSSSRALVPANKKCLEFPLFMDGQDATRAAYAIFLLNKDIEQLLNYVGVESFGPRHVLANMKHLFNTILSPEFVEKRML